MSIDTSYLLRELISVRSLINDLKTAEQAKIELLKNEASKLFQKCYEEFILLQNINNSQILSTSIHNEITILLIETAFFTENILISKSIIEEYLSLEPPKDRFYCIVRIFYGLIKHQESLTLTGTQKLNKIKDAINEITIAMEISSANSNQRYQFLVYDASLAMWNILREFLRTGRAKFFSQDILKMINALESQDVSDKYWKILFLSAGALCYDDEGNSKQASDFVDKAVQYCEELISVMETKESQLFLLQQKCSEEVEKAMKAIREIEDREEILRKPKKIDPDLPDDDPYYTTPLQLPSLEGLAAKGHEYVKGILNIEQGKKSQVDLNLKKIVTKKVNLMENLLRLHRQRIIVNQTDAKKYLTLPNVSKDIRISSLTTIQCFMLNLINEKELDIFITPLLKKLTENPISESKVETLLDISRVFYYLKQFPNFQKYLEAAQSSQINISRILRIKLDVSEGLNLLLKTNDVLISKSKNQFFSIKQLEGLKISAQLDAIKVLDRALSMSFNVIIDDYFIIELCYIIWNIIFPLLNTQLRNKVYGFLKTIAFALDNISVDNMPTFRQQLHFEIALCEENLDYISLALSELKKSKSQDFGSMNITINHKKFSLSEDLDLNRPKDFFIFPSLSQLNLRVNIYETPALVYDQLSLWIQSAKESTNKTFIKSTITKISNVLLENLDIDELKRNLSSNFIDWSIEVVKDYKYQIPITADPDELSKIFSNDNNENPNFTFLLARKLYLFYQIIKISHIIQDFATIQKFCTLFLKYHWSLSTETDSLKLVSNIYISQQIECLCILAESFSFNLAFLSEKALKITKGSEAYGTRDFSLGIISSNNSDNFSLYKQSAILALRKAFNLAIESKDIILIQNVLIYFWNLHLHIFKSYCKSEDLSLDKQNVMVEVFDFIKEVVNSIEKIFSFQISENGTGLTNDFDPKIYLNYIEILAYFYYYNKSFSELVDLISKYIISLKFPIFVSSIESENIFSQLVYYKRPLFELYSKVMVFTIFNVAEGIVQQNPSQGKGSKSKGVSTLDFLIYNKDVNTLLLSIYSNITVAEFFQSTEFKDEKYLKLDNIPLDSIIDALKRSDLLINNDLNQYLLNEMTNENAQNKYITSKEKFIITAELTLEIYSRLARLHILNNDYVAAQNTASIGLRLFDQFISKSGLSLKDNFSFPQNIKEENVFRDLINFLEHHSSNTISKLFEYTNVKIFRYLGLCEQYLSLSLMAFYDSKPNNDAQDSNMILDPKLVSSLQSIALKHLFSSLKYNLVCEEVNAINSTCNFLSKILSSILESPTYYYESLNIGIHIIAEIENSNYFKSFNDHGQFLLKNIYVILISQLIKRNEFHFSYKLISRSFQTIRNMSHLKDLWPLKVIIMSRRGLNVLDGLTKLKESSNSSDSDPETAIFLQSQILILYARSTMDISIKLNSYQQAIEILNEEFSKPVVPFKIVNAIKSEQADYILELVEVMNSFGFPRNEIRTVLNQAITILFEREEIFVLSELSEFIESKDSNEIGKSSSRLLTGKSSSRTSRDKIMNPSSSRSISSSTQSISKTKEEIPQVIYFKILEQLIRVNILASKLENNRNNRISYMLKAFFFVKQALFSWIYYLKELIVLNNDSDLSFLKFFSIPDYNLNVFDFITWGEELEIKEYSALFSSIQEHSKFLPSFNSLPCFSSTILNLFYLIDGLEEFQYIEASIFTNIFTKLLIWSFPIQKISSDPLEIKSNKINLKINSNYDYTRNAALISLQLKLQLSLYNLGFEDSYFCFTLNPQNSPSIKELKPFVLDSFNSPVHLNQVILGYIRENYDKYYQKDINSQIQYDLSFFDLLEVNSNNSKPSNLFLIEVLELKFSSLISLDPNFYLLKVCSLLKSLNMNVLLEQVNISLLLINRDNKSFYQYLQSLCFYLNGLFLKGIYDESIAIIFSIKDILIRFGDAYLLKEFYFILCNCLKHKGKLLEAKEHLTILYELFKDLANQKIQIVSDNPNKPYSQNEMGYEYFQGIKDISIKLFEVIFLESLEEYFIGPSNPIRKGLSIDVFCSKAIEIYFQLKSFYQQNVDFITEYIPGHTEWIYDLTLSYSHYSSKILRELYSFYPKQSFLYQESIKSITQWFEEEVTFISNLINDLVNLLKDQLKKNFYVHSMVASPVSEQPEFLNFKDQPRAINSSNLEEFCHSEIILNQKIGFLQLFQSQILFLYIFNKLSAASILITNSDFNSQAPNSSIIDEYLFYSQENFSISTIYQKEDLFLPFSDMIVQLTSSSMILLENTKFAKISKISFITAKVFYYFMKGKYNQIENSMFEPSSYEAFNLRASLENYFEEENLFHSFDALENYQDFINYENFLLFSLQLIIESYNNNQNAESIKKASQYTFYMNSILNRKYLRDLWINYLQPNSLVSQSVKTLLDIKQSCSFPNSHLLTLFKTEYDLLSKTNLPLKRINIGSDISKTVFPLIESLLSSSIFITIQLCPLRKSLILAAGRSKFSESPPSQTQNKNSKAKDSNPEPLLDSCQCWMIDKIILTEQESELIATLISQYQLWKTDISKFIATYNDIFVNASADDLEIPNATHINQQFLKAERAMGERHRAILSDMESFFSPLFGKDSKFHTFMKQLPQNKYSAMLFLDHSLQSLPIEGLSVFKEVFQNYVSRDFSLHFLYSRINQSIENKPGVPIQDIATLNNNFHSLIDPFNDDSKPEVPSIHNQFTRKTLSEIWQELLKATPPISKFKSMSKNNFANKEDNIITYSFEDFARIAELNISNSLSVVPSKNQPAQTSPIPLSFIYITLNKLSNLLQFSDITQMNSIYQKQFQFLFNFHLSYNDISYRRQVTLDNKKTFNFNIYPCEARNRDETFDSLAIYSLSGFTTILSLQHSIPLLSQTKILQSFWKSFVASKDPKEKDNSKLSSNLLISSIDAFDLNPSNDIPSYKTWIKHSKIVFGIPNLTFKDS